MHLSSKACAIAPLLVALAPAVAGCDGNTKANEAIATEELKKLLPIAKESAAQVRRGLPEGALKLGTLLETDPGANLAGLQKAIQSARGSVKDLDLAKTTFFSFADTTGVVLRSEVDPDLLAQKSVFAAFPALKKAAEPTSGVVEVYGEMQEMRGVRTGPDHHWVLAHPVKAPDGAVKGLFVTGWSYRRLVEYLENTAKRSIIERTKQHGKKNEPLVYVFVVKDQKAYGAPVTPDVSAQAIEKLDLIPKTAQGPHTGSVQITERSFGIAADRTPDLGENTALAVIISEI
jgi:hypothetical protein